jgi:hypothetical protein
MRRSLNSAVLKAVDEAPATPMRRPVGGMRRTRPRGCQYTAEQAEIVIDEQVSVETRRKRCNQTR